MWRKTQKLLEASAFLWDSCTMRFGSTAKGLAQHVLNNAIKFQSALLDPIHVLTIPGGKCMSTGAHRAKEGWRIGACDIWWGSVDRITPGDSDEIDASGVVCKTTKSRCNHASSQLHWLAWPCESAGRDSSALTGLKRPRQQQHYEIG